MQDLSKKFSAIGPFLLELLVYAFFISAYFFLVLFFLGGWIKQVFDSNRVIYAALALALISAQGILLELVTSTLLNVIRRRVR